MQKTTSLSKDLQRLPRLCRYDERHHRDQDDDEPIPDDHYSDEAAGMPALTLEQQKAELKRRIMQPAAKKQKVKKQKKDTVYNPDGKLAPFQQSLCQFTTTKPKKRDRTVFNARKLETSTSTTSRFFRP